MKSLFRLAVLGVVLGLGVWLWMWLFPSPEKVIRKQLAEVARCASFEANEGPVARLANVTELSGHFTTDARIYVDSDLGESRRLTLTGREQINQVALAARNQLSSLQVKFLDVNVTLGADRETATTDLTARVAARGDENFYIGELRFNFKKIKGGWMISTVEPVKVLR